MYDRLIEFDKDVAYHLFGERRGRTVSRVVGGHIGKTLGTTAVVGTAVFHGALLAGAVAGAVVAYKALAR